MPQRALGEKSRRVSKAETLRDALLDWLAYVSSTETETRRSKSENRNPKSEPRPISHGPYDRSLPYDLPLTRPEPAGESAVAVHPLPWGEGKDRTPLALTL